MPAPTRPDNNPAVINCVAYDRGGKRHAEIAVEDISEALEDPELFVWLGLHEPDEALLATLQEEFGLHHLAIEDALLAHQGTKIDAFDDSLFLVVRTACKDAERLVFHETHVFLGKRFLITIRHGPSMGYTPVRKECEATPELLALGPSYGLYAILDFVVENFMDLLGAYQQQLAALEKDVFSESYHRQTLHKLYNMQRELMSLRLTAAPLQDVTNQLVRKYPALVHDGTRIYYHDVYDHVSRVNETINAMREMLTAAMNVNLSLTSFGQNEVAKRLAGWAAIIAAPTLITSWYGMNFQHMPELAEPWAYPAVMVLVAGVAGLLYFLFHRAGWL